MHPLNPSRELSRRDWLRQNAQVGGGLALASLAGGFGLPSTSLAEEQAVDPTQGFIDAHVHVWTPDTVQFPLAEGFLKENMKPPSFTPKELLGLARPCGVGRIVLIQMSFYRYDNTYMLDTMRRYPRVFSGVAIIDSTSLSADSIRSQMDEFHRQAVKGFRLHPPAGKPVDAWFDALGIATMCEHGKKTGQAMCLLINPDALPAVTRLCEKFPDTRVVIDHFARIGADGTIRDTDLDNLCKLAKFRHTYVKVSAFYALGKKQAPYLDLAPMIRRLLDAYGPERLMWATDCPFQLNGDNTYVGSLELIRDRLDFLTDGDREWLLKKTAEKVFFS
jgi:predicted TIM-barrel fold metal-dependent hydrolase